MSRDAGRGVGTGGHRVEALMGTVVSADVRDDADPAAVAAALDEAFAWLRGVEGRFSTFRPDSEVSRLARGEVALGEVSDDLAVVLERCELLRLDSGGAFDVRARGALDPAGFVKGWAVDRAGAILAAAGLANWSLNAGGDVACRGRAGPGEPWRVGVRHPERPGDVVAVVRVPGRGAVATSGTYERGNHIATAPSAGPALASVTVVGPELAWADAFATAAFAMGLGGLDWVEGHDGYGAFATSWDGRGWSTPVFAAWRV